jgi:cell division protein FtsL
LKTITTIKNYYGFWDKSPNYSSIVYNTLDFENINNSELDERIQYLREIFQFEETRQSTIENKISQIIGQSGVVFSLAGLFIPLFFDKLDRINSLEKILLLLIFIFALFFYLWSILKATQSYQIDNYKYATITPETILKYKKKDELDKIIIQDFLYSCQVNQISNTHKANKLIYANNAFKSGSISMGVLLLFLCFFMAFYRPVNNEIAKVNVTNLDTVLNTNNHEILLHLDSLQKLNLDITNSAFKRIDTIFNKHTIETQPKKIDNK